jgi:hypothetical protein
MLKREDPSDRDFDRLKGVYRHVWVRNQRLMRFGAEVIRDLESAGIPTLVLKGAALNAVEGDLGLRLMADFDLLVPRDAAVRAIEVVSGRFPETPKRELMEWMKVHHSAEFRGELEHSVDLHWYSLWLSAPDDDFWEASLPVELFGAQTHVLYRADQLLQVCAHGAIYSDPPMNRWAMDAALVLRAADGFDWERVVEQARRRELELTLADALSYLRETVVPSVPAAVIEDLDSQSIRLEQRLGRRAATRPATMTRTLAMHWERYRRLRRLDPDGPRAASFPAHLRTWWGYDTYGAFLAYAARRVLTGHSARRRARGGQPQPTA